VDNAFIVEVRHGIDQGQECFESKGRLPFISENIVLECAVGKELGDDPTLGFV
jgi:hypothetical protein